LSLLICVLFTALLCCVLFLLASPVFSFLVNIESLPVVAEWIPYISFMRWAFQALCINEFKGQTFSCSGGTGGACLPDGDAVLSSLSFDKQTINEAVLGLGCMLMFFFFGAMVILQINQITFLSLGHIGSKMKNLNENDEERSSPQHPVKVANMTTPSAPVDNPSVGNSAENGIVLQNSSESAVEPISP
jgi:hypothetical protein